jgi:transmembrane sensor
MGIDYNKFKQLLEVEERDNDWQELAGWFSESTNEKDLLDKSRSYWEEVPDDTTDPDYNEAVVLGKIYRHIVVEKSVKKSKTSGIKSLINILSKIAAVLFIPFIVFYFFKTGNFRSEYNNTLYTEIYSPLGSRIMFSLPDGSKGWLNSGSHLKYPEGLAGKTRDIYLTGEAFFDVKTNPKKPFVVKSKSLNISAKGTSFNVTAWDDNPEINVILVEGKLDVYQDIEDGKGFQTTLSPGEMLNWKTDGTENSVVKADVNKYTSWTKGKLVFRDDPLIDVVKRINRWYNVNLVIKDNILESYKYVATFHDETLDEILKMLTISSPITFKEIDRKQLSDGTFEKRTLELYFSPHKRKSN